MNYANQEISRFTRQVRTELVERYYKKYDKSLQERILFRKNISVDFRTLLANIVGIITKYCPKDTGNARLNGIKYRMLNNTEAEITVGAPFAPYVVYLNKQPNIRNGWLYDAYDEIQRVVNDAGADITKIYFS